MQRTLQLLILASFAAPMMAQAGIHTFHCDVSNMKTDNRFSANGTFNDGTQGHALGTVTVTAYHQGSDQSELTAAYDLKGRTVTYAAGTMGQNEVIFGSFELSGKSDDHLELTLGAAKYNWARLKIGNVFYRGSCGASVVQPTPSPTPVAPTPAPTPLH